MQQVEPSAAVVFIKKDIFWHYQPEGLHGEVAKFTFEYFESVVIFSSIGGAAAAEKTDEKKPRMASTL